MSEGSTGRSAPSKGPRGKEAASDESFEGLAGLSAPARRALAGAGIGGLADLAARTEADVLRLHGMGPKAMDVLRRALADRGLAFEGGGR